MLKIEITCELQEGSGKDEVIVKNRANGAACFHEIEAAIKTMSETCALLIKSMPPAFRRDLIDACMDGMKELER